MKKPSLLGRQLLIAVGVLAMFALGVRRWSRQIGSPAAGARIEQPLPGANAKTAITAFAGTAPDDAWALGDSLYHYNGAAWKVVATPFENLVAISAATKTDAWLVGGRSRIAHWDGTAWQEIKSDIVRDWSLTSVIAWRNGEVWIADALRVTQFNGKDWSVVGDLPLGLKINALWGPNARDVWVATGYAPIHWDGGTWNVGAPFEEKMNAVAGTSTSDVWMAGEHGAVAHWDGKTWRMERVRTTSSIRAIATSRSERAVALAEDGALHDYRGVWAPSHATEPGATALFAFPTTDDYVIGGKLGPLVIHVH